MKEKSSITAGIEGKVLKYGNNINTDIISPPQYMELGTDKGAMYTMSTLDGEFYKKVQDSPILVAGSNFGSGSSRETAPLMLKKLGVKVVIAGFFARIFYRNAINIGLPIVECQEIDQISQGDYLEIDVLEGKIFNQTKNVYLSCEKIPDHLMEIIKKGGLVKKIKQERK